MADATEFLDARLAAAAAIPPESRSADVLAFLECYRLEQEVLTALKAPGYQWQVTDGLKLARADYIAIGGCLHPDQLQRAVAPHTSSLLRRRGGLGQQLLALLSAETPLLALTKVATFLLPIPMSAGEASGLFSMLNEAVALLRQPTVRRRLELDLADAQQPLPRPLLTYKQLLAFFVDAASSRAMLTQGVGGSLQQQFEPAQLAALQIANKLLPKLAPDNPRLLVRAASAGVYKSRAANLYPAYISALRMADGQGSDYYMADFGYDLATEVAQTSDQAVLLDPPSTVLLWLQQGEAAHRRAKSVLPKSWIHSLAGKKMLTSPIKPWLQQLQREGDRWRPPPRELGFELYQLTMGKLHELMESPSADLLCEGCSKTAAQLRRCAGCKEVQYCRWAERDRVKQSLRRRHNHSLLAGTSTQSIGTLLSSLPPCPAAGSVRNHTGASTRLPAERRRRQRRRRLPRAAPAPAPAAELVVLTPARELRGAAGGGGRVSRATDCSS